MSSATTEAVYDTIRTRLFGFDREGGGATPVPLSSALTGGLYIVQPPDNVVYPYGVMRLQGRETSGDYNGDRETMECEVLLFDRHRGDQMTLENIADWCDEALLRYKNVANGLMFTRSRQRDSLPPGINPTDHEVVGIRLVYPFVVWPQYLTQYAD